MAIIEIVPLVKDISGAESLRLVGPSLPVQVEVPTVLANELDRTGKPLPSPVSGHGLIDTGASITVVDLTVIQKLRLEPIGNTDVGFGAKKQAETYAVRVVFPGTALVPFDFEEVVGWDLASATWAKGQIETIVVLGRDILKKFVVVYNGPQGRVTLAR